MLKKSISLLLALIMITAAFSVLPLSVSAEETDTVIVTDTLPTKADDPTEVETAAPTVEVTEAPTEAPTEAAADYPVITGFENRSDGVKLTWEKYESNTTYRVYYRKAAVYNGSYEEKYGSVSWTRLATVTGTSYIHKDIADAEIGAYTVRAVDSKGNFTSEYHPDGWENCYYAAPSITFIAPADDGVHLSWNRSWTKHGFYNGELYRVYRKVSGGSWTRVAQGLDASSYIDTTAAPGNTYIYTVRMTDSTDSVFLSDYKSGSAVATYVPVTKIENLENGAKLSWSKFGGAAKYRVYYRAANGWMRIGQVTGTSFMDTSVKDAATRTYTVRALNSKDDFVSSYKTAGWKNTYFAAPEIKSLSNAETGVKLTWTRSKGAGEYRVYRKTAGSWQRLTQTAESSYTDTTAVSGTKYTYTLRIVDPETESFMSDYRSGKSITYVAAPVIKNVENVSNGAKLTWNKVAGADSYRIYYWNTSKKSWTRLGSKYLPEYVDTTVKSGEKREYTLRCLDAKDNFVSDYLRDGYVNTYFAPPVIKTISDGNSGVKLTWDRAKGAEDYRVYRKTGSSSWTRIAQTDASSYTDTTVSNGVNYTYTLRMVTADGERFMSSYNGGKSVTHHGMPTISSAVNGADGVMIRWTPVKGVDYYRVYYKSGSDWKRIAQVSATSFTDTSIKDGATRTYTVRGADSSGSFVTDFDRTGKTQTYYAPPVMESVAYADGAYTLTWSECSAAAGYRVYRKALGDAEWTSVIDMADTTSLTDSAVQDGYAYAYTVRAENASGDLITGFIRNPYYVNGVSASDAGTEFRFDDNGQTFTGFVTEDGNLVYYRGGVRVEQDSYKNDVYSETYNCSEWLYELMTATGTAPDCDPDDGAEVFALAKERGIISSYTEEEYFAFVDRRFAADTIVKALGYGKRTVEHVTDLSSSDSALMTLAYYGYFLPDSSDRLYPDRVLSAEEFDSLISELYLYQALKGKTLVSFGDSIMYGSGNSDRGMAEMTGEKYGMHVYDYSYPGAVMGEYSGKSHIANQVRHAIAAGRKPDVILLNGGTNDAFRTTLGDFTDGYDMSAISEKTYTNGFEKVMYLIRGEWGSVPVIYVRSHNMLLGTDKNEKAFGERGLSIAEKWNVAGIDLYNDSGLNAEEAKLRDRYTWYDPSKGYHDTIHPTALGYAEFYLPAIGEALAATFGG